jgi:hypothetical protein
MLRELAETTGEPRFRWAAAALSQERTGRPALDDTPHLDEMPALLVAGRAGSISRAAALVARSLPGTSGNHSEEATAARLRRKFREVEGIP